MIAIYNQAGAGFGCGDMHGTFIGERNDKNSLKDFVKEHYWP